MSKENTSSVMEYTVKEEIANSITHGLGTLFGILALIVLVERAIHDHGNFVSIASFTVYGVSIIALYLASTLYHSIPFPKTKRFFKTLDHCAIYVLIAGTYTPFLLVSLHTPLAIGLMVVIWALAIIGIIMKIAFIYRFKRASLITYMMMGWLSLIVIYQLALSLPTMGMVLLILGGVLYSFGVIFFVNDRIPYNHAIWHLFVLGGTISHFFAIYYFVAPMVS